MRRRAFITLLGGAAAAWPFAVLAQQAERMRRIGVLMLYPENDPEGQRRATAFQQGLQKLGWVVGRNVRLGRRRLDTIRRRAVAATGARRDPGQWHAGGQDDAAGEPYGSRHLHRRQRPGSGWLGAKPSPSRRELDRLLCF
jgi:hypothetical protein